MWIIFKLQKNCLWGIFVEKNIRLFFLYFIYFSMNNKKQYYTFQRYFVIGIFATCIIHPSSEDGGGIVWQKPLSWYITVLLLILAFLLSANHEIPCCVVLHSFVVVVVDFLRLIIIFMVFFRLNVPTHKSPSISPDSPVHRWINFFLHAFLSMSATTTALLWSPRM